MSFTTAVPKRTPYRNPKITKAARDQACMLLGPTCNGDSATSSWAHLNESFAGKGGSQKADDHAGMICCSSCHDWLDNRDKGPRRPEYFEILRAVVRSQRVLIDLGVFK